jgi:hypothetical protein
VDLNCLIPGIGINFNSGSATIDANQCCQRQMTPAQTFIEMTAWRFEGTAFSF